MADDLDTLETTQDTSELRFPISGQNEIPNWIIFERKKYQKVDMFSNSRLIDAEGARRVVLPIPFDLRTSYTSEWGQTDMGIFGNFLRDNVGRVIREGVVNYKNLEGLNTIIDDLSYNTLDRALEGAKNSVQSYGTDAINLMKRGGEAYLKDQLFESDTFRRAGSYSGVARNPYKAVLYETPSFRQFSLTFKMMAKNYDEAVTIRNIIKEFHIGMSPDLEEVFKNDLYTYPDLFEITISQNKFLFSFAPSVVEHVSVDYHADGNPIYILGPNDEQIPASVRMDVQFRETVILTKKEYQSTEANF